MTSPSGESPFLRRTVWTAEPSELLRPYVRSYIGQAFDVALGENARLTIAATIYPVISVTYEGQVWASLQGGAQLPVLSITGPLPGPFEVALAGSPRGFFVQFEPVGPLALFGIEGAAFRQSPDLDALVSADRLETVRQWGEAVGDPDLTFEGRVALTERFLEDLLSEVPAHAEFAARAAARVVATDGMRRVADLATDLGVSTSTLRRRFDADLGIAPKPFSAIVRFRHAHAYLHTHPKASWAAGAAEFGYSDQSHFIKDYERFAGVLPTRWDDDARFIDLTFGLLRSDGPGRTPGA